MTPEWFVCILNDCGCRGLAGPMRAKKEVKPKRKKVGSERMKQIFSTSAQMAISADLLCAFN